MFRVAAACVVIAWLLMQIGDTLAPALLLPVWVSSALAFVLLLGFPLALFFAWAFELTPDGWQRQIGKYEAQTNQNPSRHRFDRLLVILMAAILAYVPWSNYQATSDSSPTLESEVSLQSTKPATVPGP